MALSSRVRNKLVDAINVAFNSIGTTKPTLPPRSNENTALIAWDFFVADRLLAMAKKRKEYAHANAVRAGVIFDHMKYPRTPEDNGMLYVGEHVGIYLAVKSPGKRVDVDLMCELLEERGVSQDVIYAARDKATKESKPAHEFRVSLITDDSIPEGK